MHDTALKSGAAFFDAYLCSGPVRVLDVGAADFNGSLRSVAPEGTEYVGVDLAVGEGVDIVVEPGAPLPFEAESFDAVVSTSCFEHDPMFWSTFLQMARVVKPGGHIYVSAPSNGPYHSYPGDNWRFYPEAGLALAQWARSQSVPIHLVESGTLMREADLWNDFVAVFEKAEKPTDRQRFLLDAFPDATNTRRFEAAEVEQLAREPQDLRMLYETRGVLAETRGHLDAVREAQQRLSQALAESEGNLADSREQVRILEQAVAEDLRMLYETREVLAETRGHLDAVREAQQRLSQALAESEGNLADSREQVRILEQAVAERDAGIGRQQEEAAALAARLSEREAQLAAVYASTSWRAMAPVRWVSRLLR